MNLIWHIVKKDLRRMAAPVGVWLVLIAASAVWFRLAAPRLIGHVGVDVSTWIELLRIWTLLLTAAQWIFAVILIGALLLEDPIAPTNAFWATRPIANCRLLAAKVIATLIAFVALPAGVLVPVWLSIGCGWTTLAMAGAKFIGSAGAAVLFALTLASLAKTLRAFVFSGVGIALVTCAGVFPGYMALSVNGTRTPAVFSGIALASVFLVAACHQFLTRRTSRSWTMFATSLVVAILAAWHITERSTNPNRARRDSAPSLPDSVAATIQVDPSFTVSSRFRNEIPSAFMTIEKGRDHEFYAPGTGRAGDRSHSLFPGSNWGDNVALAALRPAGQSTSMRWQLLLLAPRLRDRDAGTEISFQGTLDIWKARAVVVGELPLQVGAMISGECGRTKIAALEEDHGHLVGIWIEEREASPDTDREPPGRTIKADRAPTLCVDRYVLSDGATDEMRPLYTGQRLAVISLNQQTVGFRRLGVPSNLRDWNKATLTKVRIISDRCFVLPLKIAPPETKDSPAKP